MFIVGIAGGSGSGKTTYAKKIRAHINEEIPILHMDSYYLPELPKECFTKNGKKNFDHPKAFDWELLRNHLTQLKLGQSIQAPVYDFSTSSRSKETVLINPSKVILFEGIFTLFDQEIREMLDILSFLHVDADIRFTRRLNRDVEERGRSMDSVINQYYETVRPMYQKFLDPQKQYADFVVGEETDIAASIMGAKIKELFSNNITCKKDAGLCRAHLTHQENLQAHE